MPSAPINSGQSSVCMQTAGKDKQGLFLINSQVVVKNDFLTIIMGISKFSWMKLLSTTALIGKCWSHTFCFLAGEVESIYDASDYNEGY